MFRSWALGLGLLAGGSMFAATGPLVETPAKSDPPGTRYEPQKIVYRDPVTGREVWRLTTFGNTGVDSTAVQMGDSSGEHNAWDNTSSRLCFQLINHPVFPNGVYTVEVTSGVLTFQAGQPEGTFCWNGGSQFSRTHTDELLYGYAERSPDLAGNFAELRAVNLVTREVRVLARFPGAHGVDKLGQSYDGHWISMAVHTGDAEAGFGQWPIQPVIVSIDGEPNPCFRFDPDMALNADPARDYDGHFWNPRHRDLVWGNRRIDATIRTDYWDVATGIGAHKFYVQPSHAFFHPNGEWLVTNHGNPDRAMGQVRVAATGERLEPIHRLANHPDANPRHATRGLDAEFVGDTVGLLFVASLRYAIEHDSPPPVGSPLVLAANFTRLVPRGGHPHPQYSPNARLVVWQSNLTQLDYGPPPGPVRGKDHNSDLFVVPL